MACQVCQMLLRGRSGNVETLRRSSVRLHASRRKEVLTALLPLCRQNCPSSDTKRGRPLDETDHVSRWSNNGQSSRRWNASREVLGDPFVLDVGGSHSTHITFLLPYSVSVLIPSVSRSSLLFLRHEQRSRTFILPSRAHSLIHSNCWSVVLYLTRVNSLYSARCIQSLSPRLSSTACWPRHLSPPLSAAMEVSSRLRSVMW